MALPIFAWGVWFQPEDYMITLIFGIRNFASVAQLWVYYNLETELKSYEKPHVYVVM